MLYLIGSYSFAFLVFLLFSINLSDDHFVYIFLIQLHSDYLTNSLSWELNNRDTGLTLNHLNCEKNNGP